MQPLTQHPLTIALMDRCPLALEGLASLVSELECGDIQITQDTSLEKARERFHYQPVDLLISELNGQKETVEQGCKNLYALCQSFPHQKIIVYTLCKENEVLHKLLMLKNISMIARSDDLSMVREFIKRVIKGERVLSPAIGSALACNTISGGSSASPLTRSENDVLSYLFSGLSLSQIAERKHRSVKTISAHKCNAMRKLHVHSDSELFSLRSRFVQRFAKG
ncbi:LuxR C-terminal-related transcriptional regulator [Dryocola clanedunensis]